MERDVLIVHETGWMMAGGFVFDQGKEIPGCLHRVITQNLRSLRTLTLDHPPPILFDRIHKYIDGIDPFDGEGIDR